MIEWCQRRTRKGHKYRFIEYCNLDSERKDILKDVKREEAALHPSSPLNISSPVQPIKNQCITLGRSAFHWRNHIDHHHTCKRWTMLYKNASNFDVKDHEYVNMVTSILPTWRSQWYAQNKIIRGCLECCWHTVDKLARLIIILFFGFASDLTNPTNLQIVRLCLWSSPDYPKA